MIMTNSHSIQDVLFFPQMRPEKKINTATNAEYEEIGIRLELVPIIQKLGYLTIISLKELKAAKLHNDVCGMRKKMKLKDVQNPTKEEVELWLQ